MTNEEMDALVRVPERWELVRDAAVLQGKLFIDGIRDFMLMPISIGAAVLDLLGVGKRAGRHFYDVMLLGRHSERFINLFGAADHLLPSELRSSPQGLDTLVDRLEAIVVQEYERGGITTNAKVAVDRALDGIQLKKGRQDPPGQ